MRSILIVNVSSHLSNRVKICQRPLIAVAALPQETSFIHTHRGQTGFVCDTRRPSGSRAIHLRGSGGRWVGEEVAKFWPPSHVLTLSSVRLSTLVTQLVADARCMMDGQIVPLFLAFPFPPSTMIGFTQLHPRNPRPLLVAAPVSRTPHSQQETL